MPSKNIPVNGWPQIKDLEAVQPTLNRLDKIEAWKRTVKEETFTGDDFIIPNALKLQARSLKTTIEAIQDLHGYDHPWAGGADVNILPEDTTSFETNTGTWYSLTGDAASNPADGTKITLAAGTYYFNIFDAVNINNYQVIKLTPEVTVLTAGTSSNKYFTLSETTDVYIRISNPNSGTVSCKSLLKVGSADASWTPYSNVCPISGRTEVTITVEGVSA